MCNEPRAHGAASPPDGAAPAAPGDVRLDTRSYIASALLVLALAAFNLFFRLGREFVTEWDEALYAISAQEMVDSGNWIQVTFLGHVDYYNTKPPLNIWLIALSFETLGRDLVSLRLASAAAAWLAVAVLMAWTRRVFDDLISLVAGLVLATTFGYLHVHSGRSANTDALFTLLVLLTVVTLWAERRTPWQRVWIGPLLAATFLLRGPAVLMPLALAILHSWGNRQQGRLLPTLAAASLFTVPVAAWSVARYDIDHWEFIGRMFSFDFVARTTQVLDEHPGGPLYYLNILVKHQYDWLAAAAATAVLFPPSRHQLRARFVDWHRDPDRRLLTAWSAITLVIPTLMLTKLPWYLNTFYPLFAIIVAQVLVRGLTIGWSMQAARTRLIALCVVIVVACAVAEIKVWTYSVLYRDLSRSSQGLLLAEADRLAGHRVFRDRFDRSATFVAGLGGIELRYAVTPEAFIRDSRPGDYLLVSGRHWTDVEHAPLVLVESNRGNRLYQRVE